jgi:IclR family transcriptional regulator, acetate operon repressor
MALVNDTVLTGASHRKTMFRDMEQSSPTGTQAVDRAAQLLIQVARHRDPVTFTELTSASGLAKSTTSRLLTALERNGLVRRDPAGRFSPGEVFVSYACRGGVEADLVSMAQPVLARLGEQTGETVNLGVPREAGQVEQIAQVDSRYLIGGTNWVGLAVPLHCAALGKVLLAFGAAELPAGRLIARTPRTITSRTALAAELAVVRDQGYAVTDEELEPGLVAVAAPVFAGAAPAVAAISVSAPATRLSARELPGVAARCMAAARALSAQLGPELLPVTATQEEGAP